MSNTFYLSPEKSIEDLFQRMMSPDREICIDYQHLKVEQGFIDRIFVVYKPTGLTSEGQHRDPDILTQIKVTAFRANAESGAEIDIVDLTTHQVMTAGYIPKRLFDYDAFVGVPPRQRVHWDARTIRGGVSRSMTFGILMKVRTKADFYSAGSTSVETPASFRALYPAVTLSLNT